MTQTTLPVGTFLVISLDGSETIERRPELTFTEDGQVTGHASVNRVMGEYTQDAEGLVIGRLATTMMAGSEEAMRQEAEVLRILTGTCAVSSTEGGSFILETATGTAELAPKPEAPTNGAVPGGQAGAASAAVILVGNVVYRERIALTESAVTRVTLEDVSLADAPSTTLASCEVVGGQVPIPFHLEADRASMEGKVLTVRATIHEDGALRWTTDTHYPVDLDALPESMTIPVIQVGG